MDELMYDRNEMYYDEVPYEMEHFSVSGYPSQDQYAEDPEVIYYSQDEYPF